MTRPLYSGTPMALVVGEERLDWSASARGRDEVDVGALVEQFAGMLYRVAFSVVRSPAEAEDIVQETFLRAVQQRGRLAEVVEVRAWLVRVAWNLALDRKRRTAPAQMDEAMEAALTSVEIGADRRLAEAAELAHVLACVDRLPKAERAVLLLGAVEGLSVAEVAEVLGRSESSVRALTFRARAHLEERLSSEVRRARGYDGRKGGA